MAFIWAVDIRGGRNPLLSKLTSNPAEEFGALLSELIPTCANVVLLKSRSIAIVKERFFIVHFLWVNNIRFSLII
jgi:hypothetical protein